MIVAIEVTPSFDRALGGVVDEDPSEGYRGLHAICGFASEAGGLRIANSWGIGYADMGTALLTPAFLGARCIWAGRLELVTP